MSGIFLKMSGILDPRIPPFRSSATEHTIVGMEQASSFKKASGKSHKSVVSFTGLPYKFYHPNFFRFGRFY